MKTATLRALMKIRIPDARVASTSADTWTVRFSSPSHLKTIREAIKEFGLRELYHDVEGSRWDWSYVFHVELRS